MKILGTLSHETKSGNLVIRGQRDTPFETHSIYSGAGTKKISVGKIQDVVGPKSRPYIIIRPKKRFSSKERSSFEGDTFYEFPRRTHAKKRGYGRKKNRVY